MVHALFKPIKDHISVSFGRTAQRVYASEHIAFTLSEGPDLLFDMSFSI